jgi:hypothetical protein
VLQFLSAIAYPSHFQAILGEALSGEKVGEHLQKNLIFFIELFPKWDVCARRGIQWQLPVLHMQQEGVDHGKGNKQISTKA